MDSGPAAANRPMDLKRKAAASVFWASLETWGQQLVQLALFAVLARMLGPEAYGLVGLAITINILAEVLVTGGGWSEALIRQRDLEPAHLDTVFWVALGGSMALALVAVAVAGPVATLFEEPRLEGLIRWLSLSLPMYGLAVVPGALLRRELRFAPHTARAVLGLLIAGAVGIAMALQGFGVWSLVGYHLTQPVVEAAVLWWAHPWRPGFRFSPAHLRRFLPYVAAIMGERTIVMIDFLLPRFIIGYAVGPVALGHYTVAVKVLDLLFQLVTLPVSRVAMPSFARFSHDRERLRGMLQFSAKLVGLAAFPSFLGFALVAPDAIPAVFGPEWVPSVWVVELLALIGFVTPLNQLSAVLMQSVGRVGWQAALMAVSALLFPLLLALFGPISLATVALALLVRTYAMFPIRQYVFRRVTGIDPFGAYRGVLPMFAAALIMAAAVLLWRGWLAPNLDVWLSLASSIAVGAGVYAAASAVLARPLLRRVAELALSLRRRS